MQPVQSKEPIFIPPAETTTTSSLPLPAAPAAGTHHFQSVFKTSPEMRKEFANFLRTIFYQLDERKVFQLMEEICDPAKTDEEIYTELVKRIDATKKKGSIFYKIWSLFVVQKGMAEQTKELMKGFRKENFQNYMEIYDRRYLTTIQKVSGLPLNGNTIALTDADGTAITPKNRLEAWALKFPYKTHVKLSEPSDKSSLEHPEITYPPLGKEIADGSVDLVTCIGGMHHTPAERLEPFLESLNQKVSPGGVVLLREHDLSQSDKDIFAMAYVVHSFVNAADGVPVNIEQKELRNFKPVPEWNEIMQRHGFTNVSPKGLILKDDPTQNALSAYMKTKLKNLDELHQACAKLPKERSRVAQYATWIEWGNVRLGDDYAAFVQNHHSYAFDFVGHLKQHWTHFYHFLKDTDCKAADLIFSDGMAMNLFIVFSTTLQLGLSALTALPSQCIARLRYGKEWREVVNLTALEKYEAFVAQDYANSLKTIPFYNYPYLKTIKGMWQTIYKSDESKMTKLISSVSALGSTIGYLGITAVSQVLSSFYGGFEPETIKVIVHDPENKMTAKTVLETEDHYKLIEAPRYKEFKTFCKNLPKEVELVEVAGHKTVSVDKWSTNKSKKRGELYRVDELNVKNPRILKTYKYAVKDLAKLDYSKVEHIHE